MEYCGRKFAGWQRFEQTPPVGAYTTPDRISPVQPATQACRAAVHAFQPPKSKFSSRSARRVAQRPPTALCAASVVAAFARAGVSSEPAGWSRGGASHRPMAATACRNGGRARKRSTSIWSQRPAPKAMLPANGQRQPTARPTRAGSARMRPAQRRGRSSGSSSSLPHFRIAAAQAAAPRKLPRLSPLPS